MKGKIRVLVADDHAIVREGLRALMESQTDMEMIGEAADGVEAIERVVALKPDVVLLDIVMPRKDGIAAAREIKQAVPSARILVLTSFAEDEKLFPAIKAGAVGYRLKDSTPMELLQAIHDVYEGRASLHPTVALKVLREIHQPPNLPPTEEPLTEREVEVLRLVAHGHSNHDIATMLVIGERTVGTHVSNILAKLHLANRTQAALYALRSGLSSVPSS